MKIDRRGAVAVLEMNAGKANAINADWLERMSGLLDDFERSGSRALVLTGYG